MKVPIRRVSETNAPDDQRTLAIRRERREGPQHLSRLSQAVDEGRFSSDRFNAMLGVTRGRQTSRCPSLSDYDLSE